VRLFEGGPDPAVLVADADKPTVEQIRARFPFLADRR
jgi:predicted amidohydrolase